ncbi:hypothetical protein [Asticcacaulis sp.]|uniref:hypothetical protein n=1 Tax=Asticcacaulis sp. TaxID=1872648 RepID=UPI002614AE85|nr:hypothetical protein [Asticcacaulis sp.]
MFFKKNVTTAHRAPEPILEAAPPPPSTLPSEAIRILRSDSRLSQITPNSSASGRDPPLWCWPLCRRTSPSKRSAAA